MIKHIFKVTKWFYILYIYMYTDRYRYMDIYIYIQTIIQEFNLNVGSHICSWEVWEWGGRGGDGCFKPATYFTYITIWLYILIYTILLYILFFKTINFFPKFNFLASYCSLLLKSDFAIFWA